MKSNAGILGNRLGLVAMVFGPRSHGTFGDLAFLLLRLVMGAAFILHGWSKIQHPFSWMGEQGFAPPAFQALAAVSEFGGGIALAAGLLVRLFSLGIFFTMATATWFLAIRMGANFVPAIPGQNGYELAAIYLCISLVLLTTGPGIYSLDRFIFGTKKLDKPHQVL